MRLSRFSVSGKEAEVLNWSLGLFLAFSAINFVDSFTAVANPGQGVLTLAFASVQSFDFMRNIETLVLCAVRLLMLEVFRRSLTRNENKSAALVVSIILILMLSSTLVGVVPRFIYGKEYALQVFMGTAPLPFLNTFVKLSNVAVFVCEVALCVQLVRKYVGRLRFYGASLIGCTLFASLVNLSYIFLYSYVDGLAMSELTIYSSITSFVSFVMSVLPFIFLRRAMVTED